MAEKEKLYGAEEMKYKGKPVLKLYRVDDERYQFFFGLAKAKMIMASVPAIREFVEKYERIKKELVKELKRSGVHLPDRKVKQ